jgi:crotonobetainyl-CoA:carnitine CoA-transferase CaiB-like acyl-CoA transferase
MRRRWQRINEQKEIDRHLQYWFDDFTRRETESEYVRSEENPEAPATKRYTTKQVVAHFQSFGVPCGVVLSPEEMHEDPQMAHRHHDWKLEHPTMGLRTYDSAAFKLSKTPGELTKASPCLGEDNEYVFRDILGLSEEEYIELLADGAFE